MKKFLKTLFLIIIFVFIAKIINWMWVVDLIFTGTRMMFPYINGR